MFEGFIKLRGSVGWFVEANLGPCGTCGGPLFALLEGPRGQRLVCVRCVRQRSDEHQVSRFSLAERGRPVEVA